MDNINKCKRCLLKELDIKEHFKNIYEYIENINQELKSNKLEYEQRLNVCKKCDNLINGMCKICGCFVEVRAVIKTNYCPNVIRLW